jgi:hypothetical protein
MIWSTHLRCAAVALFAMAVSYAVSAWAIPSARAFTMENLSTGGNTTRFAEPDGPANNFGRGAQPFGPGGPMVQFGARQGQLTPFSRSPAYRRCSRARQHPLRSLLQAAVANSTRSISVASSASALGSRRDGMAFRKRKYFSTNFPSRPTSGQSQTRHAISQLSVSGPASTLTTR